MSDHPYTYIFIRTDISYEQQLVQSSHAALEAGFHFDKPDQTSSIIMIGVKNKDDLHKVAQRLHQNDIMYKMFHEPDFGIGDSAIATEPIICNQKRTVIKKYQLYKFKGV